MADSQYVIDIAAEMPNGEATAEQLDAIIEKLELGGRKSDSYRDAVERLNAGLSAAQAVAADAAVALANGNDQYQILERDATRAAKAVERAQANGKVNDRVVQNAINAQAALNAYSKELEKLEGASKAANAEQAKIEKALKNVAAAGKRVDDGLGGEISKYRALAGAARLLPGPLGRIASEHFREETAALRLGRAFGVADGNALIFAAAVIEATIVTVALTAALAVGAVGLGAYAIAQANAAREADLTREAFAATSKDAQLAVNAFADITESTGLGEDALMRLSRELIKTKQIAGGQLPQALRAAALAEAALGQDGARDFIEEIKSGEETVQHFADTAQQKFGGVVEKKLLGLGEQASRFGRLWRDLFRSFNLDPVLQAVQVLVNMFDKANPLAQFLSFVFQKAFDEISDNALGAAYAFEAFALDVAIDVLKTYLFFRKYGDSIVGVLEGLGIAMVAAGAIWAVVSAAAIAEFISVQAAAVAAGAATAAAWLVAAAPAIAIVAAIVAVGVAIGMLINHWSEFKEGVQLIWSDLSAWLSSKVDAFVQIGSDLIAGFVRGITGAVGSVISAVSDTVNAGITAAKAALGIHSPSKVFGDIGDDTVEGYTNAVDAGATDARGSMAAMVDAEDARAAAAAPSAPSGNANGATAPAQARGGVAVTGVTFHFYGVKDAEQARESLLEAWTRLLEDDAASLTGAVVAAG